MWIRYFFLLLFFLPITNSAQQNQKQSSADSTIQTILQQHNARIMALDSLAQGQQQLKDLAEQDIRHAQSLVGAMETLVEFIALLIAILSIIGVIEIRKINQTRKGLVEEMNQLKSEREKIAEGYAELRETFMDEGKKMLQILFYITEGDNTFDAGRNAEALNYYRQAAKIRPNNPEIFAKLGYVFTRLGDFKQAIRQFQQGLKEDPKNISLLNGLARSFRKSGQYDKAEKFYLEALSVDEEYVWSLSGLGQIYLHKGDFEKAREIFEQVLEKDPSTLPMINLALAHACQGNTQATQRLLQQALTVIEPELIQSPDNTWLLVKKGLSLTGLSRYDEALKVFKKLAGIGVYPSAKMSIVDRLKILQKVQPNGEVEAILELFGD